MVDGTACLYVACDLAPAHGEADDTELFRRQVSAFDDVVAMVHQAEITDPMTLISVRLAEAQRRG